VDLRGERESISRPDEIGIPLAGKKGKLPRDVADVPISTPPSPRLGYQCAQGKATFTLPGNGIRGVNGLGALCGIFLPALLIFINIMVCLQGGKLKTCLEGGNILYNSMLLLGALVLWSASAFAIYSHKRIIISEEAICIEICFAGRKWHERSVPLSMVKGIREERFDGAVVEALSIDCMGEIVKADGFMYPEERLWLARSMRPCSQDETGGKCLKVIRHIEVPASRYT